MTLWLRLRAFEWVFVGFFCYAAVIAPFFHRQPGLAARTFTVALLMAVLFGILSRLGETKWALPFAITREWLTLLFTYVAFREMGWFATSSYNAGLERRWLQLDNTVLGEWHLHNWSETFGSFIPSCFELSYLLVYGIAAYGLALVYFTRFREQRRQQAGAFLTLYLVGTLAAYGLFPYFPSEPPRFAFPGSYPPRHTALHTLNVRLLSAATIHSGVFPSAHVSSTLSAAWALFWLFPRRKRWGWLALFYALLVGLATIYGRYHYASDVLAGILISLIPAGLAILQHRLRPALTQTISSSPRHQTRDAEPSQQPAR